MDVYIKKEDLETDIQFDLLEIDNDLKKDDTIITASLLSIFTDASQVQIGTLIDGKTLGNKAYHIDKLSIENMKRYKLGLINALNWLIQDGVASSINVETQKQGNILGVKINLVLDNGNDLNLIYSLDEKMEILN